MVTAGTALVTVGFVAVLGVGFWLLVSSSVPEPDRLLLALEVGVVVLLAGAVAYLLGQIGGRVTERQAGREAAEELKIRRERQEAQLAARQAERAQIAAREAEVVRQLATSGEDPGREPRMHPGRCGEMADAADLKLRCPFGGVGVRIPPPAPILSASPPPTIR